MWSNSWQPSLKLVANVRDDRTGKTRKTCAAAQTPYRRLLASGMLDAGIPVQSHYVMTQRSHFIHISLAQAHADPVALMATIIFLADRARHQGRLSLEAVEPQLGDAWLRAGVQLVVDNAPPAIIERLADGWIAAASMANEARTRRQRMIIAGVLMLQNATAPWLMREVFASFLPPTQRDLLPSITGSGDLTGGVPASGTEADELLSLAATFFRFGQMARRDGLLSLEDELSRLDDALLRMGLGLVLDGTPSDVIDQTLGAEIGTTRLQHGLEVARLRLIQYGMIALLEREPPRPLYTRLAAWLLPHDRVRLPTFDDLLSSAPTWLAAPIAPEPAEPPAPPVPVPSSPFEALILRLDRRAMQRVAREVDLAQLAAALVGTTEAIQQRVRAGCSNRNWTRVEQLMATHPSDAGPVDTPERCQTRIIEIIQLLETSEEIALPGTSKCAPTRHSLPGDE